MKKLLLLILVLALTVSTFAACNKKDGQPEETTAAGTTATTEETTTAPTEDTSEEEEVTTEEEELGELTPAEEAMAYIHQLYKDNIAETIANYDLVKKVVIGDTTFEVVWTIVGTDLVTIADKDETKVTVVVPEQGDEDIAYVIKATITSGDETVTREYDRVVPKFAVNTHEEYMAAKQDDVLTVQGIVVAMNAKSAGNTRNHLFLADETVTGGYYIYQMEADPIETGIEIGMTVVVTGPAAPYSGMMEIKGGQAKIVDTTIKTVDVLDITDAFVAGDNLANYVGLPVSIKGVTITDQVLGGTSEYLNFELGSAKGYLRTYVTDFPTTLKAEDKATIDALHSANRGNTADVTGILVLYSGNPYLIPMDLNCIANIKQPERNDAEKAAFELSVITVEKQLNSDKVLTLPTVGGTYADVAITWESNNAAAVVDGGTVTITVPDTAVEVTLTATATCNGETATATFTIKLSKTVTSVADAMAIGAAKDHNTYTEEKYLVGGIITEVYNTTYGNMKITDENGNILTIYGTYDADGTNRYDAMANAPVAGDYVVVLGILGQYNGTVQIKNGWIISSVKETSIADAVTLGGTFEKNNYTTDKYLVTGVVTEVQNAQYGNIVISDGNGNSILVYGTYDSTGANRYDAMANAPKEGDTVTVYGIVGYYSAPQMKNAWIVAITAGSSETPDTPDTPDTPVEPDVPAEPTIPDVSAGNGMVSADTYKENGVIMKDGEAQDWILANRANDGISGVDNIGFRGWAFLGDGINVQIVDFGYGFKQVEGITWGFAPIVDENIFAPLGGRTATRRYDITIDLTGLAAGEYDVYLYVKDSEGNVYCMDKWVDVWVKVEETVTPDTPAKDTLTIPEATTLGAAQASNAYTEEKYYITATVKNVYNATYGNMYIVDAEGNELTVYGTYSADGSTRYDAMESKPVAGDTITVYGVIGNYNGTPQMKNAWIIEFAHEHTYADATCTAPKTCACGATDGEANGHNYESGACTVCGNADPDAATGEDPVQLVVFQFGANGSAHNDGQDLGASKSYTEGGYTLALTGMSKVYGPAMDAKGNSCIKLGTSSKTGEFSFTVDENVDYVIIKVAKYKSNKTIVDVNGSQTELTKNSNDGEYDEIRVDTTTNKTVKLATVSGGVRCMIDSIAFFG